MRILLAANASYLPPRGGATRSNLVWLRELARQGHECRVVASSTVADAELKRRQLEEEQLQVTPLTLEASGGAEAYAFGPLEVYSGADTSTRVTLLRRQLETFDPHWILISSEDVGQFLLREVMRTAPSHVVYLAHTPQFFPFGPESWNPSGEGEDLVRATAGIVVIGQHMAGYVRRTLGREARVVHPPIYGDGPFRNLGRFGAGHVTLLNPCSMKGLSIFLELARQHPLVPFAVIPGWGTTEADREALRKLPNVAFLPNRQNIEDLLAEVNILLMPSLWYEGFGLIVMEAMLRGIPVIASNSGGLEEAKQGTGYVIPVAPITSYEDRFDEHSMPIPVLPQQDLDAWWEALKLLLTNRDAYELESRQSRNAAQQFVGSLNPGDLGEYLESLHGTAARLQTATGAYPAPVEEAANASPLQRLSAEKRALLLRKLRARTQSNSAS